MLVTKSSFIEKSDRKADIPDAADDNNESRKTIPLKQLSGMSPFTRITCKAKVLQADEVKITSENQKMQNIIISDGQSTARITIWDDDVGKLEIDKEYNFSGIMTIREAKRGKLYLSTAKTNCNILES